MSTPTNPAGGVGPSKDTPFLHNLLLDTDGKTPPSLQNPSDLDSFLSGSIFFVGTATCIIKWAGITIMTDPNFLHQGDHVHLGPGIYSKRLTNPAINLEDIPPIDAIVLSHFHDDHFDSHVQKNLDKTIPIITTPQAVNELAKLGFLALFPLQTYESALLVKGDAKIAVTSMPAQHSPVGLLDFALPETMGSMLEFIASHEEGGAAELSTRRIGNLPTAFRMYISGDTLMYDDLKEIPKRYPNIDLGLFHLGGTTILKTFVVTMDAKQGIECIRLIHPETAIPIHYNDYDVFLSTLEDFKNAARESGLDQETKIVYLHHGDTHAFVIDKSRVLDGSTGAVSS
ncbi:hypothetical protein HK097_005333 [Rhizophlyctis rosea]|uniref:Metallo-beta-lactamase domain-containing protein n=1 Tax=Rhizophlyctis rosea TaxID=64517 RepID=A0AAD5X8X9_9FUNG|nr:hypothetical protein HK097_005333 [Rhizophlyctis rosea]